MPEQFTKYDVELWIKGTTGDFHYKEVMGGRINPSAYDKLRKYIADFVKEGLIESCGRRDGYYRLIEELPEPIDWQRIDASKDFPIVLPFDLRKYVWIDAGSQIVVAGSKDSGKTGFLMRTVALNMLSINTIFLSNMEGGSTQLKRRFDAMDIPIPNPAPFKTYTVLDNYHDFIKEPDTLYVIDYIDVPESGEFYMIAPALAKIQKKLNNSVAIIGLQKRTASDTAYGGEQTLKKVTLYLAMDYGKLKIVTCKVPANPKVHPKNMAFNFEYANQGTNFINIQKAYF